MAMRRIIIFGNSGSGKSTLAMSLAVKDKLQHLDLDMLAWQDTQPPKRKPLKESGSAMSEFISTNDGWVIEGCYTDLLDLATAAANEMIFLNPGEEVCIENCRARPWEPHKYESMEAQNRNLDMLIEWIKQYRQRDDTFSLKAHRKLFDDFGGKKIEYVSNEQTV